MPAASLPILMTTSNVTANKIRRAMTLRKANPQFIQAVDNPKNARDLSDAAKAFGLDADVVVDVAVGTRSGVPADNRRSRWRSWSTSCRTSSCAACSATTAARSTSRGSRSATRETLEALSSHRCATFEAMKKSGLNTEIFSGGGSGTYNIMTKVPGFTDVQVGQLHLHGRAVPRDRRQENEEVFTDFSPSLTVMTTVLNNYFPNRLTTDAGAKALTLNQPPAIVIGEPGFKYNAGSDEFGAIQFEKANKSYTVGDKLELIVPHCDPAVNEYDQIYGTRGDKVEVVWAIAARGHSQ